MEYNAYCKTCNISYPPYEWKKFPISYSPTGKFEDKSVRCPKCEQWISLHSGVIVSKPQKNKFMDFKARVKL